MKPLSAVGSIGEKGKISTTVEICPQFLPFINRFSLSAQQPPLDNFQGCLHIRVLRYARIDLFH